MKQSDLVLEVSKNTSLDQEKANQVVKVFIEVMSDYIARGEKIVLSEFGSFYITEDKQVQFHPSAKIKEKID